MKIMPDRCLAGWMLGIVLFRGALPVSSAAEGSKSRKAATPPRDWAKAPAIDQLDTTENLYALGDIHGDYARLTRLLAAADLIEASPKSPAEVAWKGGKSVMVCTGDLIDKDDHALPVIALLTALRDKAEAVGGRVIVTMGNHEAEFLADPVGDTKDEDLLGEFARAGITSDEVIAGKDKLGVGQFLLTMPIAARVNDWFFCHVGNTKKLSIGKLDDAIRAGVDADGYGAGIFSGGDSLLEARMHPDLWWASEDSLTTLIKDLGGIHHLVFGHQPGDVKIDGKKVRDKGKLTSLFDGLVFMIDVGMSEAINDSEGSLLRVHKKGTEGTVIDHEGKTRTIWTK
jgi:hypothetical protein